jgi:hypothetical protein
MKRSRFFSLLAFFLFILLFIGCGKKGPLLPPLIIIPEIVENFTIVQRGADILLSWKNPTLYTDGSTLQEQEISEIEIWLQKEERGEESSRSVSVAPGQRGTPRFSLGEFKNKAELEFTLKNDSFSAYQKDKQNEKDLLEFEFFYPLQEKNYTSKKFTFALIVIDEQGKESVFSELLSIEPRLVSLPPRDIKFSVHEDRIEITWKGPEKNIDDSSPAKLKGYNIYRGEDENPLSRLNTDLLQEESYSDTDFSFGKQYIYFVRCASADSSPFWESGDSERVEISAKDIFAPKPPSGLISIPGRDYITLTWEMNDESDLFGYKVWRREENQESFLLLTKEIIRESTYTDHAVEKNKRYDYAISACDSSQNESEKSEMVSELIREEPG